MIKILPQTQHHERSATVDTMIIVSFFFSLSHHFHLCNLGLNGIRSPYFNRVTIILLNYQLQYFDLRQMHIALSDGPLTPKKSDADMC